MNKNIDFKPRRKPHAGLQKGLIIGLLIGAILGFLIPLFISGNLPFTESYSMGLGDMKGLITIMYFYCIAGGAILGITVGFIIGFIVDLIKR